MCPRTTASLYAVIVMLLRCHWLMLSLVPEFARAYQCEYNYAYHNYLFYRMFGRKIYDLFVVVRTSRRCFRVMYYNSRNVTFQYFSCYRSESVCRRMYTLYLLDKAERERSSDSITPYP